MTTPRDWADDVADALYPALRSHLYAPTLRVRAERIGREQDLRLAYLAGHAAGKREAVTAPPAPRVTAGEAWPERCLWCGSDGSFFRFCDGVCVPCSDKMQEMPKADLIRALARAVRDAQRMRRLETEPTP